MRQDVFLQMDWDHGYFSGSTYATTYMRELSPNWLDFAALVKGQRPPRQTEGDSFSYLDLGSGMGFGLCLLAAAYPEGQFTGVDFHPDHIAHSRWLAEQLGLSNVRFLEADFLALQSDPGPLIIQEPGLASYHYVVAHGIFTWVPEAVQQALLSVASAVLRPGGLFYCSYNTQPGWLGRSIYHMLAGLERQHGGPQPVDGLRQAAARLSELLGPADAALPLGQALPNLRGELNDITNQGNIPYLCGEYITESWAPLFVSQMHTMGQGHKLLPIATATLPELFVELLSEPRRQLVQTEANPMIREALFDLAINQAFRRDIFVKGRLPVSAFQQERLLASIRCCVIMDDAVPNFRFETSLGLLEADAAQCSSILAILADGPRALGEICLQLGSAPLELLPIIALLLHGGCIGLERGEATPLAKESARGVNQRLQVLMQNGHSYEYLVAPAIGSAVSFSPVDALIAEAQRQGLDDSILPTCVLMGLAAMGGQLKRHGKVLNDPEEQLNQLTQHIQTFTISTLPRLRQLGVLLDHTGDVTP